MRALVVGSTNVDLVMTVTTLPRAGETVLAESSRREPGGKGANQAVALARLGARVELVSAVGDDEAGRWSLRQLAADGVGTAQVAVLPHLATGSAVVLVDHTAENLIVVAAGANAGVVAPAGYAADVLLLSLEIPLATVIASSAAARAAGVPVVLNAAPATELPGDLLASVDVLILNEHELLAMATTAEELRACGVGAVLVTQGAEGCLVVDGTGTRHWPAVAADVVDTTGAGDCFSAAIAFGVGSVWALDRSVHLAQETAARAVEQPGARGVRT